MQLTPHRRAQCTHSLAVGTSKAKIEAFVQTGEHSCLAYENARR